MLKNSTQIYEKLTTVCRSRKDCCPEIRWVLTASNCMLILFKFREEGDSHLEGSQYPPTHPLSLLLAKDPYIMYSNCTVMKIGD